MKVSSVRETLCRSLEDNNFQRVSFVKGPQAWQLLRAEISPFFTPQVIRKAFGIEILGQVGLRVNMFEDYWDAMMRRNYPRNKHLWADLLSKYLSNFDEFISPPLIERREDIEHVVYSVVELLESFPKSIDNLVSDVAKGQLGPYTVTPFLGHWVKWQAFLKWLLENSYQYPSELDTIHKLRRIEPFGAILEELNA